jgi:hypothetical protein
VEWPDEPEPTLIGHLRFALRYEGLNLEALSLLFDRTDGEEIRVALVAQPTSTVLRRLAWKTNSQLVRHCNDHFGNRNVSWNL